MTREDLTAAGWKDTGHIWPYGRFWWHPAVQDGRPHSYEDALQAEETRKKADGGA